MAQQTINIGASPNDGTGTPLRTAFDYTNQNFTELYTATGPSGNNIVVPGSATISGALTVNGLTNLSGAFGGSYGLTLNNTTNNATAALKLAGGGTLGGGEIDFFNGANIWAGIRSSAINQLEFLSGSPFATLMTINSTGVNVLKGGTVAANGVGVAFPATQVASSNANTLDDYEEGTWTIGLTFGGGSTGITTTGNTGRYTKVGRQVTVSGILSLSNKGSSTGLAEITGLPFTIANGNEAYSAANVRFNGISFADVPICIGAINSTKILLQEITNAGAVSDITDADFTNTSSCIIGFTYTV